MSVFHIARNNIILPSACCALEPLFLLEVAGSSTVFRYDSSVAFAVRNSFQLCSERIRVVFFFF